MFYISSSIKRLLTRKFLSATTSTAATPTTTKTRAITAFNRAFLVCNITNQTSNNNSSNNQSNNQKGILKNYCEYLTLSSSSSLNISTTIENNNNKFRYYYHPNQHQNQLLNHKKQNFDLIKSRSFITTSSLQMSKIENEKKESKSSSPPLIITNVTKNLIYFSEKPIEKINKDTLELNFNDGQKRPLCIMFAWMSASTSHLKKYVKIYTNLGFDIIAICITSWQLLWPVKGAQVVMADFLKFLENNQNNYEPIIIHGFSVGGYLCGELLVNIKKDYPKYENLLNKFYAQIWDSAADVPEIPSGFPVAVFPNNPILQKLLRNYIIFHMKIFYETATKHYIHSSQHFHFTLIKAPALFLVSKNDPIGAEKSNLSVKNDWESVGVKCTWKCWDRSSHVLHYKYHTDEYMKLVMDHLEKNVLSRMRNELKREHEDQHNNIQNKQIKAKL